MLIDNDDLINQYYWDEEELVVELPHSHLYSNVENLNNKRMIHIFSKISGPVFADKSSKKLSVYRYNGIFQLKSIYKREYENLQNKQEIGVELRFQLSFNPEQMISCIEKHKEDILERSFNTSDLGKRMKTNIILGSNKLRVKYFKEFIGNHFVEPFISKRANGKCELCECDAPFEFNGEPYLETFHLRPTKTIEGEFTFNTVLLCPNCKTKMEILYSKEDLEKLNKKIFDYMYTYVIGFDEHDYLKYFFDNDLHYMLEEVKIRDYQNFNHKIITKEDVEKIKDSKYFELFEKELYRYYDDKVYMPVFTYNYYKEKIFLEKDITVKSFKYKDVDFNLEKVGDDYFLINGILEGDTPQVKRISPELAIKVINNTQSKDEMKKFNELGYFRYGTFNDESKNPRFL